MYCILRRNPSRGSVELPIPEREPRPRSRASADITEDSEAIMLQTAPNSSQAQAGNKVCKRSFSSNLISWFGMGASTEKIDKYTTVLRHRGRAVSSIRMTCNQSASIDHTSHNSSGAMLDDGTVVRGNNHTPQRKADSKWI